MQSRTNFLKKAGLTAAHLAISATALSGGGHSYYRAQRGHYSPGSAITANLNLKPLASTSISKNDADLQSVIKNRSSDLELNKGQKVRELVIVDGAVEDKHMIFKQARSGVDILEVPQGKDGMVELMKILSGYTNLDAVHLVSHAEAGAIYLGGQRIDQKELQEDVAGFAAINKAIRVGGDLMIYGCDVAQGDEGNDFLEIIKNNTHADVAASIDKTGNEAFGGNWELEIQKGDIEAAPLPESIAMKDFTGTLQFNGTIDFTQVKTTGSYAGGSSAINAEFYESASKNYTLVVDGESFSTGAYNGAFFQHVYSSSGETAVTLSFSGGEAFDGTNLYMYNSGGSQITFDILSSAGTVASSQTLNSFAGKTLSLSTYSNVTGITSLTIDASATMFIKLDNFQVANLGAPVNDNPTISIDNTKLAFTEGDAAAQIDPAGTVNDPNGDAEWNGGTLQAQITANNEAGDEISISDTDGDGTAITVSGTNIFANATDIGDLSVSGGVVTNGTALTITFDADATNAIVQEVLQSLRYRNTSDNPGTSNRTVTLTATDKNAGSNNDTRTISVATTNDAPVLDNAQSPTLTAISEDAGDDDGSGADGDDDAINNSNNPGTSVASMVVDGSITDPDGSAVEAIAVTNVDNTNGVWQYSADNGSSWSNFSGTTGSAVDISSAARLLDGTLSGGSTQKIRFVPDANYSGSATITFRAWDKTSGSAGATADATTNGGTTAFSTATDNASITINPVNDDPTVSGIPTDITVTEDTESNVDLSGMTFSDLEGNSLTVTLTASAGTFSTPVDGSGVGGGVTETLVNATTVTLAGAAADINTYLNTATNLKYTGASNASGNDAATITVEANDGNGSGDVSLGTVNIDITGTNDPPGVSGLPTDITVTEDTESNVNLSSATFNDIDGDNITVTLTASAGTFSTPVDGAGVTETLVNATTVTLAGAAGDINTYLDTATNLKYTGANNVSGNDVATLTVEANDGAGSGDVNLGTVNIDITASNDTPVLTGLDATPSFTEGGSAVTLDGDVTISDEELDALNGASGNYAGASLTIARNGGANGFDRLSVASGGNLTVAGGPNGGGTVTAGGNVIGTIANTGNGQLQL
ncbi:DUF4347 domain-containing protein, partial [Gracilimonas mengyeensis]